MSEKNYKYCLKCGTKIPRTANYCPECGEFQRFNADKNKNISNTGNISGIHGWLKVFEVSVALGAIGNILAFSEKMEDCTKVARSAQNICQSVNASVGFSYAFAILSIILSVIILVKLNSKSKNIKSMIFGVLSFDLIAAIVEFIVLSLTPMGTEDIGARMLVLIPTIAHIFVVIAWMAYWKYSKRVANTF